MMRLAGSGHNLPQAGEHGAPIGHTDGADQKGSRQETKQQLQETTLGQIFDLFHTMYLFVFSELPKR